MLIRRMDLMDALLDEGFLAFVGLTHTMERSLLRGTLDPEPAVNLWSDGENAVLTAELPGVDSNTLDVTIEGQTLTLRGVRAALDAKPGETVHYSERAGGTFERTLDLPFEVDGDKIQARFEHGVLEVTLPRAAHTKPKRIGVSAN